MRSHRETYLLDLRRTVRQLGGFVGLLLVLFSVPGIVAALVPSDWGKGLPWLSTALGAFSGLVFALGAILLWQGLRTALRLGPFTRPRRRRKR